MKMKMRVAACVAGTVVAAIGLGQALAATEENAEPEQEAPPEFRLSSSAFENGKPIPLKHTGEAVDVSPPLQWIEPPQGTKTFALIVDDPDAPMGTWVHWVMYNIPGDVRELKEGMPTIEKLGDGTIQGVNDFGKIGYNGPMPPPGKPHRYYFKLYALDTQLELPAKATNKKLEQAMQDHILGEAKLMGTYSR